ncbi:MAG: aldo/keto reductase [Muribaculaceae bacterium]|nr:aldo/keto reductase [Muribaculaceae bacterium]
MSKSSNNDNSGLSRRSFLKYMGIGAAAGALGACSAGNSENTPAQPRAQGEMTYRTNHNTGDKVSILGYGCMRLPTTANDSARDSDSVIDQEAVNRSVDYAMAHGVNYYDTSPMYCKRQSERAMGIALSRHPRESYFLATKLSNFDPTFWPREKSIEMFNQSLRNLQTDYIDYMLLHAIGGRSEDLDPMQTYRARFEDNGILDFLKERRAEGTVRNLGFSYHGDISVFDYLMRLMDEGKAHWDFVQIQLNYVDWDDRSNLRQGMPEAEYLYRELAARNIPVVIMEPLLGGRLAKVPKNVEAKMKQRRPADSIASWAFRYAGTFPEVLTVLSGMTYMEHLQDNLATYSPLEPLNDDERAFLHLAALDILQNATVPCTDCRYCLPCPYGLDIPGIFRHYNKCINDDNAPRDVNDPRYAEARRAYLVGYDREVPRLRQANRCVQCRACEHKCPQQLPIVEHLANISHYTERLRQGKA